MAISVGDRVPQASFVRMGSSGPEQVDSEALFAGRKVALFAVPGAFTGTCTNTHVPGIIAAAADLRAKGVDEIVCLSVNDPFVMQAWGEATGANAAGITMLGDPESQFTRALGLNFSAPPIGLIDRSQRYSMLVEDGVVTRLNIEENAGEVVRSGGAELAAQI
ncbi:MAG: peroxiredoxin [Alphaproteobacteria bacterium]|nr:MAG: peroxiredoxin [Alphaproteobacteria bacterium]